MEKGRDNKAVLIIIALVVIALLIALVAWVMNSNNTSNNAVVHESNDTANNGVVEDEKESTLTKILDNPDQYIGQKVTVTAEVQDVLTPRAFKISDDVVGDELTVITSKPLSEQQTQQAEEFLQDNANVRVEGTVRRVTVAEVERDYTITLDPEIEVEFENKVVLVADSINFTDRSDGLWDFSVTNENETEGQ